MGTDSLAVCWDVGQGSWALGLHVEDPMGEKRCPRPSLSLRLPRPAPRQPRFLVGEPRNGTGLLDVECRGIAGGRSRWPQWRLRVRGLQERATRFEATFPPPGPQPGNRQLTNANAGCPACPGRTGVGLGSLDHLPPQSQRAPPAPPSHLPPSAPALARLRCRECPVLARAAVFPDDVHNTLS